jgi:cobalamin synthase
VPESSKADPITEVEPRRDLLREAWTAASACTGWIPYPTLDGEAARESARALVFVPVVGLIIGIALAFCDRASGAALARPAQSAVTIIAAVVIAGGLFQKGLARTVAALIAPAAGHRSQAPARLTASIAAALIVAAEIFALSAIDSPPARARAVVLALLLSRWAMVPIGYGLRPLESTGLGISHSGGIRFAEFAVSSVIALGLAMGLYDVVGLAAIVAVALTILGLRLLLSRRLGGVGGNGLAAGAEICQLVVFAILAALSNL